MKRYFISLVSLLCFVLSLGAQGQTVAADSISTDSISLGEVVVKASANTHTLNTDRFMVTKKMREGVHVAVNCSASCRVSPSTVPRRV